MFAWWSKKSLSQVKWAVEDVKQQQLKVQQQIHDAAEARTAALAELSAELRELRNLEV